MIQSVITLNYGQNIFEVLREDLIILMVKGIRLILYKEIGKYRKLRFWKNKEIEEIEDMDGEIIKTVVTLFYFLYQNMDSKLMGKVEFIFSHYIKLNLYFLDRFYRIPRILTYREKLKQYALNSGENIARKI